MSKKSLDKRPINVISPLLVALVHIRMSSLNVTENPVNQRRIVTVSQMDAVGRMEGDTAQPVGLDTKDKVTPPTSPARASAVALGTRVDVGRPVEVPMEIGEEEEADEDYDMDADLERLLGDVVEGTTTKKQTSSSSSSCCGVGGHQVGNTRVIFPRIFARTGWGMVGPHWFGPVCVLCLILWASHFFIHLSLKIGPVTTATCILFTLVTVYNLGSASFRDPGIVKDQPETVDLSNWRWCDFCRWVTKCCRFDLPLLCISPSLCLTRLCIVSINLRMECTVRIAMFVWKAMITIVFGWERALERAIIVSFCDSI
jgi:hypothetical protein